MVVRTVTTKQRTTCFTTLSDGVLPREIVAHVVHVVRSLAYFTYGMKFFSSIFLFIQKKERERYDLTTSTTYTTRADSSQGR